MAVQDVKGIVNAVQNIKGKVNIIPSGGGGSDPVIQPLSITENGTYTAPSSIDGYSPVVANVPTGPQKSASDVTVSGKTVTVPAGLYASQVQKSVADGTEGTPAASKTISGHTATVTPTVTNGEGYISGGTKNGTPVTVTAAELASGTKSITENGEGIDVVGYASVDVNVSGGGSTEMHESGTVAFHTGANNYHLVIPVSDITYDHYLCIFEAVNSWLKVGGEWVEQDGLNFTGGTSVITAMFGACRTDKWFNINSRIDTTGAEQTINDNKKNILYRSTVSGAVNITSGTGDTATIGVNQIDFTLGSNNYVCAATYGMTYKYDIWGWNDA